MGVGAQPPSSEVRSGSGGFERPGREDDVLPIQTVKLSDVPRFSSLTFLSSTLIRSIFLG